VKRNEESAFTKRLDLWPPFIFSIPGISYAMADLLTNQGALQTHSDFSAKGYPSG
jgi:hypothetical protein